MTTNRITTVLVTILLAGCGVADIRPDDWKPVTSAEADTGRRIHAIARFPNVIRTDCPTDNDSVDSAIFCQQIRAVSDDFPVNPVFLCPRQQLGKLTIGFGKHVRFDRTAHAPRRMSRHGFPEFDILPKSSFKPLFLKIIHNLITVNR